MAEEPQRHLSVVVGRGHLNLIVVLLWPFYLHLSLSISLSLSIYIYIYIWIYIYIYIYIYQLVVNDIILRNRATYRADWQFLKRYLYFLLLCTQGDTVHYIRHRGVSQKEKLDWFSMEKRAVTWLLKGQTRTRQLYPRSWRSSERKRKDDGGVACGSRGERGESECLEGLEGCWRCWFRVEKKI